MTETEAREMLRRVGELYITPALADDEFTCQQFADLHGISYNQAKPAIKRAIAAGAMVAVGRRRTAGRAAEAYKLV